MSITMAVQNQIYRLVFFVLLFLALPSYASIFKNLKTIKKYAAQLEEFPDADNIGQLGDWLDPDYSTFHKKNLPGFIDKLLIKIYLYRPAWNEWDFAALLKRVVKNREERRYSGRFVQKIKPNPESQFVIFGNLHGAFHSLLHDLQELEKQGIIDDNLKIIKPDCYIIFIGNVIDRSPFVLETLTVVMRLMLNNPDNVFYIRGDHEDKDKWHRYGLKRELVLRASSLSDNDIPLGSLMSRFFNTLPLALYLAAQESPKETHIVRISSFPLDNKELEEQEYGNFWDKPSDKKSVIHLLRKREKSSKKIKLDALIRIDRWSLSAIRGIKEEKDYSAHPGLLFLGKKNGTAEWSVLSSNTNTSRRLLGFIYDSFVVITTAPKIDAWKISQWSRKALLQEDKEPFHKIAEYNLILGYAIKKKEPVVKVPTEPEISKIVIGSSIDLTKGSRIAGQQVKKGVELVFNKVNKAGGVNGLILDWVVLDDGYNTERAGKNIEKFLKKNITILLSPFGTPTLKACLDRIKEKKIVVLFPIASIPFFQELELPNLIFYRPSEKEENYVLINYMLKNFTITKYAFFYQEVFGIRSSLDVMYKSLQEAGIKWVDIPYSPNDVNFAIQIKKIKEENPGAIGFSGTTIAAKALIQQIGIRELMTKKLFGMSDYSEKVFRKFIKKEGLVFIFTSVVPNPETSQLEIAKEFRKEAKKFGVVLDGFSFEGYINASVFVYILKRLKGPITKESIIKVIEQIKNVNFKGLKLDFDQKTRRLSHSIWISPDKEKWEKIDFKEENQKNREEKTNEKYQAQ